MILWRTFGIFLIKTTDFPVLDFVIVYSGEFKKILMYM